MTNDKRYDAHFIEWDNDSEEYVYDRPLTTDGTDIGIFPELTGWDTFEEFVRWFNAYSKTEREEFQDFMVCDSYSGSEMMVAYGIYDEIIMRLDADRYAIEVK